MHKQRSHSKLSPSQAERFLVCGASVYDIEEGEDDGGNAASNLGTAAHELFERCVTTDTLPSKWLNTKFNGMLLGERERNNIAHALAYVKPYRAMATTEGAETEVRIPVLDMPDAPGSGHVDFWTFSPAVLNVFDYKNGRYPVDPRKNWQAMLYALGLLLKLLRCPRHDFPVRLHIIQPNAYTEVGVSWRTTAGHLIDWADAFVAPRVAEIIAGSATYKASGKGCYWCPVQSSCQTHKQHKRDEHKRAWGI